MAAKLIFVYNADSGLYNTLSDIAHKVFSPQTYACRLCALTHSYFTMRDAWKTFIEHIGVDCEFLHRDQFHARYPAMDIALPAVLRDRGDGPHVCLDAAAIKACGSIQELQASITSRCIEHEPA